MIVIPQWVKSVMKYLGLCVVYGLFSIITASIFSMIFMKARFDASLFYGFIIAIPIFLLSIVLITVTLILLRRRSRVIIFTGFILIFVGTLTYSGIPNIPSVVFRRVLTIPIPDSVSDIKVDPIYAGFDCTYVLSFNISEPDFNSILAQKRFKRVEYAGYDTGAIHLSYGTFSHGTLSLYYDRKPPLWFDLQTWISPQTYDRIKEDDNEQYLIYNRDKGRAFLIDCSWK